MLRRAALALAFLAAAAAQEAPKNEPGALLARQQLVSMRTLAPTADLGVAGHVGDARCVSGDTWSVHDLTVDVAAQHVLDVSHERVRLRGADRREVWAVGRADAHVAAAAAGDASADAAHRLFGPSRIVLQRDGGGLVALDRATGGIAWQKPDAPCTKLVADPELLLAIGTSAGKPVLAAFAWANGAQAFRVELPAMPVRVVPAPHGVAVVFPDRVVVHDRSGPRLFVLKTAAQDIVAASTGWYVRTADALQAWTQNGELRWTAPSPLADFDTLALAATPAGDLVAATYIAMADSGVTVRCLTAANGEPAWRHVDPGLGVAHSKYWHRVYVRTTGDAVFVVSQAAGGNFVVELDAATGERRRREVLGKP